MYIDEDATPVVQLSGKFLVDLREKLKKELDKIEDIGQIKKGH